MKLKLKKYDSDASSAFAGFAGAIGKGLLAGAAGTLAITLSQMIEMKITKREPSEQPAEAAEKVLDVKAATEQDKSKFSNEVHWAYGTTWGIPRAIMGLLGLKGLPATALHFATIYTSALVVPTQLNIAPPLKEWEPKEFAVDALHHLVYAVVAGLAYDAMSEQWGI